MSLRAMLELLGVPGSPRSAAAKDLTKEIELILAKAIGPCVCFAGHAFLKEGSVAAAARVWIVTMCSEDCISRVAIEKPSQRAAGSSVVLGGVDRCSQVIPGSSTPTWLTDVNRELGPDCKGSPHEPCQRDSDEVVAQSKTFLANCGFGFLHALSPGECSIPDG